MDDKNSCTWRIYHRVTDEQASDFEKFGRLACDVVQGEKQLSCKVMRSRSLRGGAFGDPAHEWHDY